MCKSRKRLKSVELLPKKYQPLKEDQVKPAMEKSFKDLALLLSKSKLKAITAHEIKKKGEV